MKLYSIARLLTAAALLPCAGALASQAIDIPNASFESPATEFVDTRIDSWQKMPKPVWYDESGGNLWDQLAGVFKNTAPNDPSHIDNLDGDQAIYLFALPMAGVFQDYESTDWASTTPRHAFNALYEAGKSYRLTVGVVGGGGGMAEGSGLLVSLYYRDAAGSIVPVASTFIVHSEGAFPNTTQMFDYEVRTPVVTPSDPWAGQHIGVQFLSTGHPDPEQTGGYWDLDHVRLAAESGGHVLSFDRAGSDLRIGWPSAIGQQYQVQVSDTLGSWSNFEESVAGTGEELSKLVPLNGSQHSFFRVVATSSP